MSRSRPRVVSRCSLKISSGVVVGKQALRLAPAEPPREVDRDLASPAAPRPARGTAARTREMRRSELVTVPSFSPQLAAGSSTSA